MFISLLDNGHCTVHVHYSLKELSILHQYNLQTVNALVNLMLSSNVDVFVLLISINAEDPSTFKKVTTVCSVSL